MLRIKHMVPRVRPIIDIYSKYKSDKVLSFIVTEFIGIIRSVIPYLPKYPYLFYHVAILPVACTLSVSKFFGYVNEVDFHSKSSQSGLALNRYELLIVVGYWYVQK